MCIMERGRAMGPSLLQRPPVLKPMFYVLLCAQDGDQP